MEIDFVTVTDWPFVATGDKYDPALIEEILEVEVISPNFLRAVIGVEPKYLDISATTSSSNTTNGSDVMLKFAIRHDEKFIECSSEEYKKRYYE